MQNQEIKKGAQTDPGFQPYVVLLFCQQAASSDVAFPDSTRWVRGVHVRMVPMPCSSKVEISCLVKLLASGVDAVQVVGCPPGQCRFLAGTKKTEHRVGYVRGMLSELGLGPERVGIIRGSRFSLEDLLEAAYDRAGEVMPLGPNPMKKEDKK